MLEKFCSNQSACIFLSDILGDLKEGFVGDWFGLVGIGPVFIAALLWTPLLIYLGYGFSYDKSQIKNSKFTLSNIYPAKVYWNRTVGMCLKLIFLNSLVTYFILDYDDLVSPVRSTVTKTLVDSFGKFQIPFSNGWIADITVSVAAMVAFDFGFYVFHWCAHNIGFMWEFHKVHHSPKTMTPLVTYYQHPFENARYLLATVFSAGTIGLLSYFFKAPPSKITIFGVSFFGVFFSYARVLSHSNVWWSWGKLQYVFQSPASHIVHHSTNPKHFNKNLGINLTIFDQLFGTFYPVTKEPEEIVLGVDDGFDWENASLARIVFNPIKRSILVFFGSDKTPVHLPADAAEKPDRKSA